MISWRVAASHKAALNKQEDVGESAWNGKAPTRQTIEPIMDGTECGGPADMWWLFGLSIGSLLPLRTRLWLGRLLFRPFSSNIVVRVSWHRVIKGPCRPTEVEGLRYIAEHTTIPVPKVFAVHIDEGCIYVEMSYIKGQTLGAACRSLSTEQKNVITAELKQYLTILRELPPPVEDQVSSAFQNPTRDFRVGQNLFGPVSLEEFHGVVRGHIVMEDIEQYIGEDVVKLHTTPYQICFTHADLAPRNIIVRNGHVAAIVDWDFSGWYPEYWEYIKAHWGDTPGPDTDIILAALPKYDAELEAERKLWQRLPDMGTTCTFHREGVVRKQPGSAPSKAWMEARMSCPQRDLWTVYLAKEI
ncbi:hypothetical protein E4U43_007837 [Claviceps pusilla]|uniref:non-specific serine/threonine protein kinase n=1 Tax=Claviceps pusilla TaxID=123648 RepID=A0A9P7NEA2_9HYPO|nr:hypothetical protein E4U43_007837 [Claviceps pusilla]